MKYYRIYMLWGEGMDVPPFSIYKMNEAVAYFQHDYGTWKKSLNSPEELLEIKHEELTEEEVFCEVL